MSILEAIILGVVQGLTEFIPVSSSGHLVLLHQALGITEQGLTFDVALHVGTLLALVGYFHRDIVLLTKGLLGQNEYRRVAWLLVVATAPAVVSGMLLEGAAKSTFRSVPLVAINLIAVGGLMLLAERLAQVHEHDSHLKQVSLKQALIVGTAQAAAVIPGVSRSGSTITAGLLAGLDRVMATRFSFLLGIPITAGAVTKVLLGDSAFNHVSGDVEIFAVGVLAALVSGLFAIRFLLRYLARHSLTAFAYYRLGLGVLVLLAALWMA